MLFTLVSNFTIDYMDKWLAIVTTGINFGTLLIGFKIIRQMSRLEYQVELMWAVFKKKLEMGSQKE